MAKNVMEAIKADKKVMLLFWSMVACLALFAVSAGLLIRLVF